MLFGFVFADSDPLTVGTQSQGVDLFPKRVRALVVKIGNAKALYSVVVSLKPEEIIAGGKRA